MKNQAKVLTCVTIVLLCVGSWAPAAEFLQFSSLFNGKDLSGWVNVNTVKFTLILKPRSAEKFEYVLTTYHGVRREETSR